MGIFLPVLVVVYSVLVLAAAVVATVLLVFTVCCGASAGLGWQPQTISAQTAINRYLFIKIASVN
jgi:predicted membrane protein